ncbi:MAG: hypothetical protein U9Q78_07710 [Chloroflexota bacterium]|nr:hypothetical protein [Chloroflexota bacterium]
MARYGEPTPRGVAKAYVQAYTSPDDLILVPFCQSAPLIREIQATGRRLLALDFNPVEVLALRMALAPPAEAELLAAFTRLGDAPKAGEPLRQHLEGLYTTPCPRCRHPALAEAFVWDREEAQPVERRYRCPACGDRGSGPVEEGDLMTLEGVESRGLAYWYLADHVAPASCLRPVRRPGGRQTSPHRRTVLRLLDIYTPRNLYALAQILIKMERLFSDSPVLEAMRGALLGCLDVGSALYSADAPDTRPHRLQLPHRYLERNVWECFEKACEELSRREGQIQLAPDLNSFLEEKGEEVHLQVGTLHALSELMGSIRVPLIVAMPPRFDPLFWSLSYLWSGWLYGPRAAKGLEPLLGRRSSDWEWYRRSLQGAFQQAGRVLQPEGHLLLLGRVPSSKQRDALLLAASGAGFTLSHALSDGEEGVQLHFRREPFRIPVTADEDLATRAASLSEGRVTDLLRARGEPTLSPHLRMAAAEALARRGWLPLLTASEEPMSAVEGLWEELEKREAFVHFDDGRWWLHNAGNTAVPLADRVETEVYEILAGTLGIAHKALLRLVCKRFSGPLTPSVTIVEACLRSYGEEFSPGYWRLRADEEAKGREAEIAQVTQVLERLGRRMGYEVEEGEGYDMIWREGEQPVHGFLLRWEARVATAILHSHLEPRAEHQYYVLPQARVELVQAKLAHDPRLGGAMARGNWHFLKYAPLRALAEVKQVTRHDLQRIVGLEPIIEQPKAQIPLF